LEELINPLLPVGKGGDEGEEEEEEEEEEEKEKEKGTI